MWKKPDRPNNAISQTYNSGVVTIYAVTDAARPGYKPTQKPEKKMALRYDEQRLGINRAYLGRQNQVQIERVIRVPHTGRVSSQDIAVTEDDKQYRIDLVQLADGIYPPSDDLTLSRIEQKYEV